MPNWQKKQNGKLFDECQELCEQNTRNIYSTDTIYLYIYNMSEKKAENKKAKACNAKAEDIETKDTASVNSENEADIQNDNAEDQTSEPDNKTSETGDKMSEVEAELSKVKEQLAKEKDDYLRLMAEFNTFRRRTAQEKLELVSVASQETIKGLLPVLDDCERAMAVLANSSDSAAAKEGTELIYSKLMNYLKTKGLEVIEAKGEVFNTDLHEAVAQFPVQEESEKGKVFDVCQTGYTLNGKVIRFAKVVVGI